MPPKFRRSRKTAAAAPAMAAGTQKKSPGLRQQQAQARAHRRQHPRGGSGPPALPHGMVAAGLQWFKAQHRPGADTPHGGADQAAPTASGCTGQDRDAVAGHGQQHQADNGKGAHMGVLEDLPAAGLLPAGEHRVTAIHKTVQVDKACETPGRYRHAQGQKWGGPKSAAGASRSPR